MDNPRRIGIRAVPPDADIARFLQQLIKEYEAKLNGVERGLADTVSQTAHDNEPEVFAFAKMLNYLATLTKPELIELLASSLWKGR